MMPASLRRFILAAVRKQQSIQTSHRSFGRPLLGTHQLPGPCAEALSLLRITQKPLDYQLQGPLIANLDCCARFYQPGRRVSEVPHVGPENNGHSVRRRFDHVLSTTATIQAPAHEGEICQPPK